MPSSAEPARRPSRGTELERLAWPILSDTVLDALRRVGRVCDLEPGEVLFEVGQERYELAWIEHGEIEIVDRSGDRVVAAIDTGNFVGELGLLTGQGTFLAGVAAVPTRVVAVAEAQLRELIATVPEASDAIVAALAARRRLLVEWGEGGLVVSGERSDPATVRLLTFATRTRIPHRFVEWADAEALTGLLDGHELPSRGPVAVTGSGRVLVRPEPRQLAEALGVDLRADVGDVLDVAIVGAGPAGLATAVYGASEGLRCAVVDDTAIGGQAGTSSRIENYLGFSTGVSGAELAFQGEVQALKFGARFFVPRRACGLSSGDGAFALELDDGTCLRARAVVLANGVQYRRLPLDGLAALEGAGVYYAATELEARLCTGGEVVVVGGGNSAGQAAMFLSRHASCVHVVVRGDGLAETMSSYLSERVLTDPRIRLWTGREVSALHGRKRLEGITLRSRDGSTDEIPAEALFLMIGAAPNTGWLQGQLELDRGFVVTGHGGDPFATSMPGVWAVGDIRAGSVKRVASAVGEGSVVVSGIHRYLQAALEHAR